MSRNVSKGKFFPKVSICCDFMIIPPGKGEARRIQFSVKLLLIFFTMPISDMLVLHMEKSKSVNHHIVFFLIYHMSLYNR